MTFSFDRAFEVYELYTSMQAHFSSKNYDYFESNSNCVKEDFEESRNYHYFVKISRSVPLEYLQDYFLYNFLVDKNLWIVEMFHPQRKLNFNIWKSKLEHIEFMFHKDIDSIMEMLKSQNIKFDDLFDGKIFTPYLMKILFTKQIELETFMIINELVDFFPEFKRLMPNDHMWNDLQFRCEKYMPFLYEECGGPIENIEPYKKYLISKINNDKKEKHNEANCS